MVTKDEAARLVALRGYEVMDTPPEASFDEITQLAAYVCGTPTSLVTFIDETRQWFKSRFGFGERETPRDIAFCAHTIAEGDMMVIADACSDARFANNPLVTGDPYIRFYAGARSSCPAASCSARSP